MPKHEGYLTKHTMLNFQRKFQSMAMQLNRIQATGTGEQLGCGADLQLAEQHLRSAAQIIGRRTPS